MFGDLAGGISDVFGNILEGINSTIEGVGSVVEDVAQAAGQVGAVRTQIEGGIEELGSTIRGLPDIFRGRTPSNTRGQDIATGAVLGEVAETVTEYVEDAYDYFLVMTRCNQWKENLYPRIKPRSWPSVDLGQKIFTTAMTAQ